MTTTGGGIAAQVAITPNIVPSSSATVPFTVAAATAKNNRNKKKKKATPGVGAVEPAGPRVGAVVPATTAAASGGDQGATGILGNAMPQVTPAPAVPKAKRKRCGHCNATAHVTNECPVDRHCYICDMVVHPTTRCPTLRLPKPYAGLGGIGSEDTMFSHLPDGIFKPQLAQSQTPVGTVTVTGGPVSAETIQSLLARICPAKPGWCWEAIEHKEDVFLVNFP